MEGNCGEWEIVMDDGDWTPGYRVSFWRLQKHSKIDCGDECTSLLLC